MMTEFSGVLLTHVAVPTDAPARPTVFLDRDGVIIENRADYVRSTSDVALIPGAVEAVRLLHQHADIVVVTNQSVIGRGLRPRDAIIEVHQFVIDLLARRGATIRGSVICPHTPTDGCDCRKPRPGMLHAAAAAWACPLDTSWLVGDALTDVQAGDAAGARTMLVRTGRGAAHEDAVRRLHPDCLVVDSLATGAGAILPG